MSGYRVEDGDVLVGRAVRRLVARRERPAHLASYPRSTRFVGVHGLEGVVSCPLRAIPRIAGTRGEPARTVLYVAEDGLAAELHSVHRCADVVCVFRADAAGGRLEEVAWPGRLLASGLTPREADVLALLLVRRTNAEIADRLVVSAATVRSHCRAVLRKLGATDRRDLWRRFPRPGGA